MSQMKSILCTILRGERDKIICRLFSSPDVRQIDGLGEAAPLTSKLATLLRQADLMHIKSGMKYVLECQKLEQGLCLIMRIV